MKPCNVSPRFAFSWILCFASCIHAGYWSRETNEDNMICLPVENKGG